MPSKKSIALVAEVIKQIQLELCDYFQEKHPEEIIVMTVVRPFIQATTVNGTIAYVRDKVYPHHIQIKTKNLEFFSKNKDAVFQGLPPNYIAAYAALILGESEDFQESLWNFFGKIIEAYEKLIAKKKNA